MYVSEDKPLDLWVGRRQCEIGSNSNLATINENQEPGCKNYIHLWYKHIAIIMMIAVWYMAGTTLLMQVCVRVIVNLKDSNNNKYL